MSLRWHILLIAFLLLVCLGPTPVEAEPGEIVGVVLDTETRQPLDFVIVYLTESRRSADTDDQGNFTFTGLEDQTYTLLFCRDGYQTSTKSVAPSADRILVMLVSGEGCSAIFPTSKVIERRLKGEVALDAPGSGSLIKREEIEEATVLTPVDQARTVTGIDFASKGMIQHTYAVRGHRSVNSGALLVMTDYRYASIPALDINVPYLLAVSKEDIDRIEVARGPGSALYGPNSDRGILHLITRSPFESRGTSLSLGLGERDVLQGWLRHAGTVGSTFGYKISGEYFRGNDWEFTDPVEQGNREKAIDEGASPDTLIGVRDNRAERAVGEVRMDWRPAEGSEWILTGGVAQAINVVDLTTLLGAVQVKEWLYPYVQLQTRHGEFFANLLYNGSNSGDTFALRTGDPLVDESRLVAIQLQHGSDPEKRTRVQYGVDARRTEPRTRGTINGRNEEDDAVSEIGAYLSSKSTVSRTLDLVGALRVDYNDRVNDAVLSPRLGVVFRPAVFHALRCTYNRAFSSPDAAALFLDVREGDLRPLPYDVRATAVPKDGFTFSRSCADGLCMQNPWGLPPSLPADATLTWDALVAALGPDSGLSQIPAPNSSQVSTDLRSLRSDPENPGFDPVQASDVTDVPGPQRVIRNTLEVGYKGILGNRVQVHADAFWTHIQDNRGPPWAATPNVFFNQETLETYLRNFMSPDSAAAAAAAATDIPMGTVSPDQVGEASDILFVTHQVDDFTYTFWGVDLWGEVTLSRRFALGANYSYFHENVIEDVDVVGTVILSVPNHKGAAWLRVRGDDEAWTAGAKGRIVDEFLVNSGVYRGKVDAYAALDLDAGLRLTRYPRLFLSINATNVFDTMHQEYIGAAEIGRLVMVRLQMDL